MLASMQLAMPSWGSDEKMSAETLLVEAWNSPRHGVRVAFATDREGRTAELVELLG